MTNDVKVQGNTIIIVYNGKLVIRSVKRIHFCEVSGRNCNIYFDLKKPVIAPIAMKELEQMLSSADFGKCHIHYLIHYAILRYAVIEGDKICYDKFCFPIARLRFDNFMDGVTAYYNAGN